MFAAHIVIACCMNAFILIRLDGIPSQQEQLYLRIVKFLFLTGLELKDRYVIKNQLSENIVSPQKSTQALIKILSERRGINFNRGRGRPLLFNIL